MIYPNRYIVNVGQKISGSEIPHTGDFKPLSCGFLISGELPDPQLLTGLQVRQ